VTWAPIKPAVKGIEGSPFNAFQLNQNKNQAGEGEVMIKKLAGKVALITDGNRAASVINQT
jgi:hypothetical protein